MIYTGGDKMEKKLEEIRCDSMRRKLPEHKWTIQVDGDVHKRLNLMKANWGFGNINSAIFELLEAYE